MVRHVVPGVLPMPGFDGTGPLGRGPMTGRRFGKSTLAQPEKQQDPSSGENQPITTGNFPVYQQQGQGQTPVYGVGRGGIPCGGGRGFGGRGGRRGRCFTNTV